MTAAPFSAVFFEGRFLTASEQASARVSITERGYLLGEGVFATLRGYQGACFRPAQHLAHFARGAEAFGLPLPMSLERLAELADEAAVASGAANAYVRITLTRGTEGEETGPIPASTRGPIPIPASTRGPILSVLARPFELPSAEDYTRGICSTIVTPRRIPPACMDPSVKTTSYAHAVLARREAERHGAPEGIQLAVDGSLACGTMANLFLVKGNILRTPATFTGCRAGVTREAVIEIAPAVGLEVREEWIDPSALTEADEIFFTSTRVECLPIASIEGRAVGRSDYPRTSAVRSALRRLVEKETTPRRSSP